MDALSRSKRLGSSCRQALRCLHQLFWGCLWPSGGSFQFFVGAYPSFVEWWGGFQYFGQVGDSCILNHSIKSHNLRINLIDSVFLVIE